MPELPEVETVRRQLLPLVEGRTIRSVTARAPMLFQNCEPEVFTAALTGRRIEDLHRWGKYLVFVMVDCYPVFHLGMSGIFLTRRERSRFPQHIHVEIDLDDGSTLFFQDFRKFGKIWLYDEYPEFPQLGIDPVNCPPDMAIFTRLVRQRNQNLKLFLMDQGNLAGVGNIYASEMLHHAGISPYRRTGDLSDAEIAALHAAMNAVLQSAIANFGTTYSAYQTVTGESGTNQEFLQVYQLAGTPCRRCGAIIEKAMIGNRSTFFCRGCQH